MRAITRTTGALVLWSAALLGASQAMAAAVFALGAASAGPQPGVPFAASAFEFTGSPVAEGIRLNGGVGPLGEAEYEDFHVVASGPLTGGVATGDRIRVWYAFRVHCTTGFALIRSFDCGVQLRQTANGPVVEESYGSHPETPIVAQDGDYVSGWFDLESFDVAGLVGDWTLDLGVEWIAEIGETDTFELRLESAGLRLQLIRGASCPGDTNLDRVVDFVDLNRVLGEYGQSSFPGELFGDLDDNGEVDFVDLNLVLGYYGRRC